MLPFLENIPAEWKHSEVSMSTSLKLQGTLALRADFSDYRGLIGFALSVLCNIESSPAVGKSKKSFFLFSAD